MHDRDYSSYDELIKQTILPRLTSDCQINSRGYKAKQGGLSKGYVASPLDQLCSFAFFSSDFRAKQRLFSVYCRANRTTVHKI